MEPRGADDRHGEGQQSRNRPDLPPPQEPPDREGGRIGQRRNRRPGKKVRMELNKTKAEGGKSVEGKGRIFQSLRTQERSGEECWKS